MVHPNALIGKKVVVLTDMFAAFKNILLENYNAESKFRNPIDLPIENFFEGEPPLRKMIPGPSLALILDSGVFKDAPQDAGSDNTLNWRIMLTGVEHRQGPQQSEALRMAQAFRHIILDNRCLEDRFGNKFAFDVAHDEMTMRWETLAENFDNKEILFNLVEIELTHIYAETGF